MTEGDAGAVPAEQVRAALENVLASSTFQGAGRASAFLRFIVEETLAGHGKRLKGYSIAVTVFERPADFDAQSDPLVRVEAGRLRRRLTEYYVGPGRDDRIRIELPRGGYTPVFVDSAAPGVRFDRLASAVRRRGALLGVGAGALLVGLTLAWLLPALRSPTTVTDDSVPVASTNVVAPPHQTSAFPRVVMVPFSSVGGSDLAAFARGLTEETLDKLVAFNIFMTATPSSDDLTDLSWPELRQRFDARYALTGAVRAEDSHARVTVRLTETEHGTQLWARTFDESLAAASRLDVQTRLGGDIANLLSSPFGPVYTHEIARLATKPVESLDSYECLVRYFAYSRTYDPQLHHDSVQCMEHAIAVNPNLSRNWGPLAGLYLHEYLFGYDARGDGGALERATEAARRSLEIERARHLAALTLATIQLLKGDVRGYEAGVASVAAMKPVPAAVWASIGYTAILRGDWQRGLELLEKSFPITDTAPSWYFGAHALACVQRGHYEDGLQWARKMDAQTWWVTPMLTAATAGLAGDKGLAHREARRLLKLRPDFPHHGREHLERWQMDEGLLATLLDGLRRAGVPVH